MKTQKGVVIPDDFANALKKNQTTLAAFEAMPPSHQLEYCEAIVEAKKPEIRQRRITGAIEMILKWSSERAQTQMRKRKN